MQEIQKEIFSSKEKEILGSMFGGEEKFKEEFPALYEDMVTVQNQAKAPVLEDNPGGWEDYEKLKLCYQPKTKTLKVKGRIHKSGNPQYIMAHLKIWNREGKTWQFSFTSQQNSFLIINKEIQMESNDLSSIQAEINYIVRFSGNKSIEIRKLKESIVSSTGIDIIGNGRVLHPVIKPSVDFEVPWIDIVYFRKDKSEKAVYYYENPDRVDDNFCVYLPIAMQFELESNMTVAQNPEIRGDVYVYSLRHSTVHFKNFGEVKLIPASKWDDRTMNPKWKDKPDTYPHVDEKSSQGYVLIFPQAWNSYIEKDGVKGEDEFYLSLNIEFKCTDGKKYSLEMDSRVQPKKYEGGNVVEIPYMHLYWGCLEKNVIVNTRERGNIRVCDVRIGEFVASLDGTYKRVINAYSGAESSMVFLKADGKDIRMTKDHPVKTKDGWKQAQNLTLLDQICMEEGRYCKLDELYIDPYYDHVYSLELEDGEGFFANGFYVGDFMKQNSMIKRKPRLPEDIMEQLDWFTYF